MEKNEIQRHINEGALNFLEVLGDAAHMEHYDDGFCTTIHPKEGEVGGTSIFNFRYDNLSSEELIQKVNQIKEKKQHTFWGCYLPEKVQQIIDGDRYLSNENTEDVELYMAVLPEESSGAILTEPSIIVNKVSEAEDFRIWTELSNNVLSDGFPIMHPDNHYHLIESGKMVCYIGYYNGVPASTSAILNNRGVASLEFAATLDEFRKKGAGRAVCSVAVHDAFKGGAVIVTTRAIGVSHSFYKSLGFESY